MRALVAFVVTAIGGQGLILMALVGVYLRSRYGVVVRPRRSRSGSPQTGLLRSGVGQFSYDCKQNQVLHATCPTSDMVAGSEAIHSRAPPSPEVEGLLTSHSQTHA